MFPDDGEAPAGRRVVGANPGGQDAGGASVLRTSVALNAGKKLPWWSVPDSTIAANTRVSPRR